MSKIRAPGVLALAFILLSAWPSRARAQRDHCDPGLPVSAENPIRYQVRGTAGDHTDRCEGTYIREVAGATLLIASLTTSFGDFDLTSGEALHLEWPAQVGPVRLRSYGLRERLYYRMDTEQAGGAFTWPTNVLAALNVRPGDIGVVGWTERLVGATRRSVYLPLTIRQRRAPSTQGGYRVVLLPGRELVEVHVTLAMVNARGTPATYLRDAVALEFGYYPAGRGIVIPITEITQRGLYYLELAATLRGGGSVTTELWLDHPGQPTRDGQPR